MFFVDNNQAAGVAPQTHPQHNGGEASQAAGPSRSNSYTDVHAIIDAYGSASPGPSSPVLSLHGSSGSYASLSDDGMHEALVLPFASRTSLRRESYVMGSPAVASSSTSTPELSTQSTAASDLMPVTPFVFRPNPEVNAGEVREGRAVANLGPQEFLLAYRDDGSAPPRLAYCASLVTWPDGAAAPQPQWAAPQLPMAPQLPSVERFEEVLFPLPPSRGLDVRRSPSHEDSGSDEALYMTVRGPRPRSTAPGRAALGLDGEALAAAAAGPSDLQPMGSQHSTYSSGAASVASDPETAVVQQAIVQPAITAQARLLRLSAFFDLRGRPA
jgi:hypothetical protein